MSWFKWVTSVTTKKRIPPGFAPAPRPRNSLILLRDPAVQWTGGSHACDSQVHARNLAGGRRDLRSGRFPRRQRGPVDSKVATHRLRSQLVRSVACAILQLGNLCEPVLRTLENRRRNGLLAETSTWNTPRGRQL